MADPVGGGGVTLTPNPPASALPGLMGVPEYWQELVPCIAVVNNAPEALQKLTVHPAGTTNVNPVRANWLLAGLVSVKDTVLPPAPVRGAPAVTEMVGRLALAAKTAEERGIAKSKPENARMKRRVPELIFLLYAFVGVYIYLFKRCRHRTLYKGDGQIVHFCHFGA